MAKFTTTFDVANMEPIRSFLGNLRRIKEQKDDGKISGKNAYKMVEAEMATLQANLREVNNDSRKRN